MDTTKLTREEALRRWNASKENKRKMVEKLENLVRKSCLWLRLMPIRPMR